MEHLRLWFLLFCWAVGVLGGFVEVLPGRVISGEWLALAETWGTLIQLDRAYDAVPNSPPFQVEDQFTAAMGGGEMMVNSRLLVEWTKEILPYFVAEGIVERSVAPEMLTFEVLEGDEAFSVAGLTWCYFGAVALNARYANPVSDWYGEADTLSVLVHELGHVQGLCSWEEEMETANQLVTVEVLASMANRGNRYAVKPLLYELRSWALVDARVRMADLGLDPVVFNTMIKGLVYTEPYEQTRLDKSDRFWADEPELRQDIFKRYYVQPYRLALEAMSAPGYASRTLPLDMTEIWRSIEMDDLAYFWGNLNLFVELTRGK